jgi:hypothetical protein
MRALILAGTVGLSFLAMTATAQTPSTTAPQAVHYSTADTDLGTLLDDAAARAIVDKYLPGFSANEQIDMARSLTLKALQQYSPDTISDQALAKIDADFATLPVRK